MIHIFKKKSNQQRQLSFGFTLIEMVMTVAIMAVLVVVSLVNYTTFNERQQVETSVESAKSFIRIAQRKAQAQDTPGDCNNDGATPNPLQAYRVYVSGETLKMQAVCGPRDGLDPNDLYGEESVLTFPAGVTIDSNFDMFFYVLYGGTKDLNGSSLTLSKNDNRYLFEVEASGVITQGEWFEG